MTMGTVERFWDMVKVSVGMDSHHDLDLRNLRNLRTNILSSAPLRAKNESS